MCGRFTLTLHKLDPVIERLNLDVEPTLLSSYRPRYNVAPGNAHWIVRSPEARRELVTADWGLINSWSKDSRVAYKQINARAETLAQRPAWRSAFRRRRCLVAADGFYEWSGPKNARQPMWFYSTSGGLMWLAGLYEGWEDPATGESRTTFSVITTEANRVVQPVHHRMPVIIAESDIDLWMNGPGHENLLQPAPDTVVSCRPVSRRVNSPRNDEPSCLLLDDENDEASLPLKQLGLFEG